MTLNPKTDHLDNSSSINLRYHEIFMLLEAYYCFILHPGFVWNMMIHFVFLINGERGMTIQLKMFIFLSQVCKKYEGRC